METYIAMLRGINVSGHRIIKMNNLAAMFEGLGFNNVKTYIQSGNVIFSCKKTEKNLEQVISKKIVEEFGFDVPVMVKEKSAIAAIIGNNPFIGNAGKDLSKVHITFLANPPDPAVLNAINIDQYLPDELVITDAAVYIYCPNGYGNTKLNNNFFESKLKVTATTRNWKTVNELLRIADL